jgi:hypothetical protein
MPRQYEQYRLQLIIEYNRVLAWGKAAGLVDVPEGSDLGAVLGADSIELVSTVARIQWILSEFRDLNARYGNEVPRSAKNSEEDHDKGTDQEPTDLDVLKDVSSLAVSYEKKKKERRHRRGTNHIREFFEKASRNTKDVVTHPVRVRWVAVDKDAFEALLKDLHVLTERLHELMRNYRERQIDSITAKTYREMVLARNNITELKDMLDAISRLVSTSAATRDGGEAHANDKTLQDLVRLKKISRTSETILAHLQRDPGLDLLSSLSELGVAVRRYTDADLAEDFAWNEHADQDQDDDGIDTPELLPRPRGILATASEGDVPVWVEWKALGDAPSGSARDREAALRTLALAEMLRLPKPAALRATPECVGYFDDREVSGADRYGWIFKMPEGCDYDTRVRPLRALLGDPRRRPTLRQRVAMAEALCGTVLNLHAVNWLHKGVMSDNVVFHLNGEEDGNDSSRRGGGVGYDPEKPVLSGFEYSRPDGGQTTARDVDVVWDLYRWPAIQREHPTERNSRKTYDLYSLGLVLLEIAHWEKLHKLMYFKERPRGKNGEEGLPDVPLEQSKSVREWLLGIKDGAPFEAASRPNPLGELRNIVGDRYWKAVERCLWAHGEKGFGVEELADQSNDSSVGIALQEAFTEHVVEALRSVHV